MLQFSQTGTHYVVYGQVQDLFTRQQLADVKPQILAHVHPRLCHTTCDIPITEIAHKGMIGTYYPIGRALSQL